MNLLSRQTAPDRRSMSSLRRLLLLLVLLTPATADGGDLDAALELITEVVNQVLAVGGGSHER